MLYPNTRGSAARNGSKVVRLATHLECLNLIAREVQPKFGLEHGMGNSSAWFHSIGIEFLLSFEDEARWSNCDKCTCSHDIVPFESTENFVQIVKTRIPSPNEAVALVDGPGLQRIDAIVELMKFGIEGIVYHDAETIPDIDVEVIRKVAKDNNYFIRQYIGESPESLICCKRTLELDERFVEF